jgi:hypothetical protein
LRCIPVSKTAIAGGSESNGGGGYFALGEDMIEWNDVGDSNANPLAAATTETLLLLLLLLRSSSLPMRWLCVSNSGEKASILGLLHSF